MIRHKFSLDSLSTSIIAVQRDGDGDGDVLVVVRGMS